MNKRITQGMNYKQFLIMKYAKNMTSDAPQWKGRAQPLGRSEPLLFLPFIGNFSKHLAIHNRHSNNLPIRPLHCLSPVEFTVQYV